MRTPQPRRVARIGARRRRALLRSLALGLATSFAVAAWSTEVPETPAISPDVLAKVGSRPVHGTISGRRSTHDGRVRITGNGAELHRVHTTQVEVFGTALAGEAEFSDGARLKLDPNLFHASTAADLETAHVTICDPYLAADTAQNPYVCAHGNRSADCYDVSILQIVHVDDRTRSELWTTPVTITVTRPKTASAEVAKVTLRSAPVKSPIAKTPPRSGAILIEPVTSGDGRLLVVNSGSNLLYSVMGSQEEPCDARGFKRLEHISKMHKDGAMSRYELARYPIRDTENRTVKSGKPIRGAYPWIDRDARNLFFTQVSGLGLYYDDGSKKLKSRFDVANPLRKRRFEEGGPTRFGMSYFGLWTQGKVVIPDTRVNAVDFQLGRPDYEPRIHLYDSGPAIRVGEGTITKINSQENEWNYRAPVRQRAPFDVVWWLSANNDMTGEVVFDSALDLGTLIYSPMNASIDNKKRKWRDGFDYGRKLRGYVKTPRLQNGAASQLRWSPPTFGKVSGARIEPVAAGGVVGKGLWLDGQVGRVDYTIPQQSGMQDEVWATSLWVDPRALDGRRRLLTYPDGSYVDVTSAGLTLGAAGGAETPVTLPGWLSLGARKWTHLTLLSGVSAIEVYVQGFRLATISGSFLRVAPGTVTLGRPGGSSTAGFRGWVDEFRVASGLRGPETFCNWAHGTLRGLNATDDATDFGNAGTYPQTAHDAVSQLLTVNGRPTFERYLCERDRRRAPACLDEIHRPSGVDTRCVREALHFPEGPIFHDRSRPDSTSNSFCLSCHTRGHPTPSLRANGPLSAGSEPLIDDTRRQPSQAPRRIHGFIPKSLLGLGQDLEAPPAGLELDPVLYPASAGDDSR